MEINRLFSLIVSNFSPELLKTGYWYDVTNPTKGFCYIASECLYHCYGKHNGFYPVRAKDEAGVTHWWLENKQGEILDITASQYTSIGLVPPYKKGRRGGFLTKQPSKRCVILMQRIGYDVA